MKFTSIIAATALLEASAHRLSNQQKLFNSIDFVVGTDEFDGVTDTNNVLLEESKIIETPKASWAGWHPHMNGFPGTVNQNGDFMSPYTRVVPARFVGDSADETYYPTDKFTQNLLHNYAIEGVNGQKEAEPIPTGHFYLTKEKGFGLAAETICTHFSKCGDEGKKFLDDNYAAAFDYYDVNKEGRIDAVGMTAQMMRYLCQPLGWLDI
jgi:hypothetical protein